MAINPTLAVEEPVETTVPGHGGMSTTKTTHPAFAQISASRVSGRANLYGSDFSHHNYITIAVQRSELHRSLSNDWHFARQQMIEIALSEAQWATLVSSLNTGGGVPCTLQWTEGQGYVPRLPDPKVRADQFSGEMSQDFEEALASLDALQKALEDGTSGLSGKKAAALFEYVRVARSKITSAAPFVANQFGEHMEKEMERAKVEIHGYFNNLVQRAGVAALTDSSGPLDLQLEDQRGGE